MTPKRTCPAKKCLFRSEEDGTKKFYGGCENTDEKFCPFSHWPWHPVDRFCKYTKKYREYRHCKKVWRDGATKYGYDPDISTEEDDDEEEEEEEKEKEQQHKGGKGGKGKKGAGNG